MPPGSSSEQLWIQADGRAQVVDILAEEEPAPASGNGDAQHAASARGLSLIRRAAALALEGGRHRAGPDGEPLAIRAPVPLHAAEILDRLLARGKPYGSIEDLRADLIASRDQPTEVGLAQRGVHLAAMAGLHLIPVVAIFILVLALLRDNVTFSSGRALAALPTSALIVTLPILAWSAWSAWMRGGLAMKVLGLGLVGPDGRLAGPLRCGWRCLLAWIVPATLLIASGWAHDLLPTSPWPAWSFYGLAVVSLLTGFPLALLTPSRGPHDRLAGTTLVPR
jgi:hypothetical protein